ncbi:hypothetical protein HY212_01720 [Candidatus Pacearchaeota archaeon]|nr:hypothetical protein [Candidatus Pacearchaeota archaeon]
MIAVTGGTVFGGRVVTELKKKNIDAVLITSSLRDIHFKKKMIAHHIIHFIGSPTVTLVGILALIRFRIWHKKIVVSWIGFDVRRATGNMFWKLTSRIFDALIDVNITDDNNMVKELDNIGINAKAQPIPIYSIYEIKELHKEKKVAVYLPDKLPVDFNFYQGSIIKKLVNLFPNVEFLITRNSGSYFNEKNVKCFKWIENMEEIYAQVIAVIRLPIHDATGATIIEALSMGRTVIASATDFPYCKIVKNFEDAKKYLSEVIANPSLNVEGSVYVHKKYNNSKFADALIQIYKNLLPRDNS